jgi:uncharacterized protein YdeI (YjbR/CyaY-like superfamily)
MATDPETVQGVPTVRAENTEDWRSWLAEHGRSEARVAVVLFRKKSELLTVRYQDAVEHALCFGWVDYKGMKRDDESFYLFFSPRGPKSTWSSVNRERAERMIQSGLMTEAGQAMIDLAKGTGTWEAHRDADNLVMPHDLQALLDANDAAWSNFSSFPPSSQRLILGWIATAKRPETRQRRMAQTVALAAENIGANH